MTTTWPGTDDYGVGEHLEERVAGGAINRPVAGDHELFAPGCEGVAMDAVYVHRRDRPEALVYVLVMACLVFALLERLSFASSMATLVSPGVTPFYPSTLATH